MEAHALFFPISSYFLSTFPCLYVSLGKWNRHRSVVLSCLHHLCCCAMGRGQACCSSGFPAWAYSICNQSTAIRRIPCLSPVAFLQLYRYTSFVISRILLYTSHEGRENVLRSRSGASFAPENRLLVEWGCDAKGNTCISPACPLGDLFEHPHQPLPDPSALRRDPL